MLIVVFVAVKQGGPGHGEMGFAQTNTVVAPAKSLPVPAMLLPPPSTPAVGETTVTPGLTWYVYLSPVDMALTPPTLCTVMSTGPTACTGMSCRVILVTLLMVKQGLVGVPGHGTMLTSVAPTKTSVAAKLALDTPLFDSKPVPVTTIGPLWPPVGPVGGETPVTVGTGA